MTNVKVTLKQVGIMQEVNKAKTAFFNSGIRSSEQRNILLRIEETGGSFRDSLIEEAKVWASELTHDDVEYWNEGLPTQFQVPEAEYFFGWVAEFVYGPHSWFKLMKEVWNA